MKILTPAFQRTFSEVRCGVSTRLGGATAAPFQMNLSFNVGDDPANVRKYRALFFGALGIGQDDLAFPEQVHSGTVRRADGPGHYPECDALFSNTPGVYVCVTVADCLPIFLFDPLRKVVAAVHAGWRGSERGITRTAVLRLKNVFGSDPADLYAYIGAGADSCCYTVGRDVASRFDTAFLRQSGDGTHLDMKRLNAHHLESCGVQPSRIEVSPHCTICEPETFHSFRREGERSGRMMAVIGLARQARRDHGKRKSPSSVSDLDPFSS